MKAARRHPAQRGLTLIEVSVAAAIVAFGLLAVVMMVLSTTRSARSTLGAAQAQAIAERLLEQIVSEGCTADCGNIQGRDGEDFEFFWSVNGTLLEADPGNPDDIQERYLAILDVDPPFEGAETGDPPLPFDGSIVNVRVTVTWVDGEQGMFERERAVALQTRMTE